MFGCHKEDYKIDGESYRAVANFVNESIHIYGRNFSHYYEMEEYLNFEGNMKDFVMFQVKGK